MEFMSSIEKVGDAVENAQFCIDMANLCQDTLSLKRAKYDLYIEIMTNWKNITKDYVIDRSNAILDRHCRKYGISYKCVAFEYALIILDRAINDMNRVSLYKGADEAVKRQLKMRFQNKTN